MSKLEENNKCLVGEKMDKAFDYEEELKGQYYAMGRYEGKAAIAKKLLNLKMDKDQISQVTGLPKKEIEKLIKLNA